MSVQFATYNEATQQHIIELGCFIYDKSLDHYREQYPPTTTSVHESNVVTAVGGRIPPYEYHTLKQQLENLSARVFEVREEEYKKGEAKLAEYKQQLASERQRLDKILATIQSDTDRQITAKTEHLNKKIAELETKNKWYYSLYEDKSKGKNYEEELYPKLLDYNDAHLNSIWQITHVGSVLSEKTDFHFRHKDMNMVVLLDTKNNLPTNPVVSTAEFERDVLRKETNAIGGVMLANGNIACKKRFEINKVQHKTMVYVSCYDRDNIGFLFSLLDMIVEMARGASQSLEHDGSCSAAASAAAASAAAASAAAMTAAFRELLISEYKREQSNLDNAERLRKSAQKSIDAILSEFETHFPGEDIEMAAKSDEVTASSVRIKPKTSTDIIDYTVLEKDRTVIGQRSKYYLEYGTTIQYFKNNYARNQKVKSLDQQVVISVQTSSSSSK
jgi:flagellar hook-associated protein FlgK